MRLHQACSSTRSLSIYLILLQILSSLHFFSLKSLLILQIPNLQWLQLHSNNSTHNFSKSLINKLLSCKLNISSSKAYRKLKIFSKLRFSCLKRTFYVSHSATLVPQVIRLILIRQNSSRLLSLTKRTFVKTSLLILMILKERKNALRSKITVVMKLVQIFLIMLRVNLLSKI